MRLRTTALLTTTFTAAALVPVALPATATAAPAKYADDFDGDGYRDYAARTSTADDKGGAVRVTFGTPTGPGTRTQVLTQKSPGVPGADETDDMWGDGTRVAADFNRDGYGDLVVPAVNEKVGRNEAQGAVTILWGSKKGLSRGTALPNKNPQRYGNFGQDLATGDFNGDGKPDLAVVNDGDTYVHFGPFSPSGAHGPVKRFDRDGAGFDAAALIAGKVTKDRATDLVVIGSVVRPGKRAADAWFIKGGKTLRPGKALRVNKSATEGGDGVIADFDKDGYGDIAIGNPEDSHRKGAVTVWRGGPAGPGSSVRLTQAGAGIAGTPEKEDAFGSSVSAGDTNGDGYQDLAIGAHGETINGKEYAGGVHLLRGGRGGLKGTRSQWFARNTPGVPGELGTDDTFGRTVRLRDTDLDGHADLYVAGMDGSLRLPGSPSGTTVTGGKRLEDDEIVEGILQ
ncbi:FG-GAP-like repeat-containing protein [Streptomyces sp. MNP-20]|uniref:FG-GAP-like repeat-containing protein n=1 Tax=Streptomyces sp. MNP-20 TaxID=2721165 RepID=UPI0020A67E31|nr:FG-GAP-like repeat-containing protein [Streptomyces sp. MNP-20]